MALDLLSSFSFSFKSRNALPEVLVGSEVHDELYVPPFVLSILQGYL